MEPKQIVWSGREGEAELTAGEMLHLLGRGRVFFQSTSGSQP